MMMVMMIKQLMLMIKIMKELIMMKELLLLIIIANAEAITHQVDVDVDYMVLGLRRPSGHR